MAEILLIEDEPWLGELYMQLLVKADHTVHWKQDNYGAINLLEDKPLQLIVLDLMLPWTNGLQLLHEMASYDDLAKIPVILCTSALAVGNDVQWLKPYGVVDVFYKAEQKPQLLVQKVRQALNHAYTAN